MQFPGFISTGVALQTRQKTDRSLPKFAALDDTTKALIRTAASQHYDDFSAATKQPVKDAIQAVDSFVLGKSDEKELREEAFDVAKAALPSGVAVESFNGKVTNVAYRLKGWFGLK